MATIENELGDTIKEIMSMLDDKGIEYNQKQTKAELIELLAR